MSKKYNKNIHRFIALSLFLINCVVFNYKCVWADKMVESNLNEIFISEDNYFSYPAPEEMWKVL